MRLAICEENWLFASVVAAAFELQGHEVVTTTDDPRQLFDVVDEDARVTDSLSDLLPVVIKQRDDNKV